MWSGSERTTLDVMNVRTVHDPAAGRVISCAVGSRLVIRLGRLGLVSRWRVDAHPCNLVPLVSDGYQLEFLVFDGDCGELVLTRYRRDGQISESLTLYVEPVPVAVPATA